MCKIKGFSMTIFSYTHTTNCIYLQPLSLPYFHFPFDSLPIFKQTSPFHFVCICIYMYIHMRACFNLDICKKEISFLHFIPSGLPAHSMAPSIFRVGFSSSVNPLSINTLTNYFRDMPHQPHRHS